jgi:hypothetical protein
MKLIGLPQKFIWRPIKPKNAELELKALTAENSPTSFIWTPHTKELERKFSFVLGLGSKFVWRKTGVFGVKCIVKRYNSVIQTIHSKQQKNQKPDFNLDFHSLVCGLHTNRVGKLGELS